MRQSAEHTTGHIGAMEKLSYLLANIGNIPLMTLTGSFLLIFYTNVVGLNPAAVATLFLISRVLDGINDPVMGFLIDRMPRGRYGRFRPLLILGSAICCINYVLLWFGPVWAPAGKLVIVYITYLLLGITFDLMDIALNSLLPVMTDDTKQRSSLSTLKGVGYIVGTVLVTFLAPLILSDASNLQGYYVLIFSTVALVFILSFVGALGVKERVEPISEKKYTILEELKILLEKPVLITFLSMLMFSIGSTVATTTNTFFYTYIMGDLKLFSTATLVTSVGIIPGVFAAGPIINKFGKKAAYIFALLIPVPFMLMRLINVQSVPILFASCALTGMSTGIAIPMRYGMQADNTDYIILKRRQHAEAAIASLSSFISKCAMGVGGAIPGYLLAVVGFQGDTGTQPPGVATVIILCSVILPVILSVLAAVVFGTFYPITRQRLSEQTEALRRLREQGE